MLTGEELFMYRRYLYGAMAVFAGAGAVFASTPLASYAAVNFDMRKKILKSANIIDSVSAGNEESMVSRAEFAKMLVRASSYNNSVSAYNNVSVFPDVATDNTYASFIRLAAEKGWMTAYLGGNFKPDQPIKFHEAVRACLTLLGYTSDDFSGNQVANRIAKAQSIGFSDDLGKSATDELSYQDCINLFYNLLITNTKSHETETKSSSTIYGAILGFTLTSDNELNMMDTLTSNLKGPYVLKSGRSLSSIIPFSESDASCFLDGASSDPDVIEDAAESEDVVVVYYNTSTKSVYAYTSAGTTDGDTSLGTAKGTLDAIYYNSSNVMTPTSISVDGVEYKITSTDMQYAFSIYGSLEVSDTVTIVYETDSDGNKVVISYVKN